MPMEMMNNKLPEKTPSDNEELKAKARRYLYLDENDFIVEDIKHHEETRLNIIDELTQAWQKATDENEVEELSDLLEDFGIMRSDTIKGMFDEEQS